MTVVKPQKPKICHSCFCPCPTRLAHPTAFVGEFCVGCALKALFKVCRINK